VAKLYFRHGTMGSAKTLNLLAVAHNYSLQGKKIYILKPLIDNRFGEKKIRSRAGLEKSADFLIGDDFSFSEEDLIDIHCLLIDEAQFLKKAQVDYFRELASLKDIPVICYGLRTDFKQQLFEGSKRLLELADSIEEVKNTCHYCDRKALFNLRRVDGKAIFSGPQIQLGAEELYVPVCPACYEKERNLQSSAKA